MAVIIGQYRFPIHRERCRCGAVATWWWWREDAETGRRTGRPVCDRHADEAEAEYRLRLLVDEYGGEYVDWVAWERTCFPFDPIWLDQAERYLAAPEWGELDYAMRCSAMRHSSHLAFNPTLVGVQREVRR